MHQNSAQAITPWQHDHRFDLHRRSSAESRTAIVAVITILTMAAEIAAGMAFGSMALLADGLHMGSHAVAIGINAFAYVWMRRRAGDALYSHGTGKISALGGYTGAVLLVIPAVAMAWESVVRLVSPRPIDYSWAIGVAVLGLLVNGACALILQVKGVHHDHAHHGHHHHHGHRHSDHNLRSAYLHVIADGATSLLAIFALAAGALWGVDWLDPLMGILGAGLILVWAKGLFRDSTGVLLDRSADAHLQDQVRQAIEGADDNRLADMHIWMIGPGIFAAELSLVTHHPKEPDYYKNLIPAGLGIRHVIVEVHTCPATSDRLFGS
jgi:cation diffusion facilitator family transporter